jgi:NADH-quinone oxidoreductase subunit C
MPFDTIIAALTTTFGGLATSEFRDNRRILVPSSQTFNVLKALKTEHGFDMLFELTAADYLKYPHATDRFGVIYGLLNTKTGERVYVKTMLNEPDLTLPSAFPLWKGADWLEREVYDMYGILFDGHPDLRRILTDYGFIGHPFRKDFPISGYVEMRYDPEQKRVVYQPVTIEPREVTPRIVREEHYGEELG